MSRRDAARRRHDDPPTSLARTAGLAAWLGGLAVGAVVLHGIGRGGLGAPPLADPGRWSTWVVEREAPTIAFAVVRLIAEGVAWYLLAVTLLHLVADLTRSARLGSVARLATAPGARRLVAGVAGVTVASSLLAIGAGRHQRAQPIIAVAASSQRPAPPATGSGQDAEPVEPGTATQRVEDPAPPGAPATAPTWTVGPGDHFWAIAAAVLAPGLGRAPTDAEITPYWRALVEQNRPALADPSNPDLLFTGQVLHLPPVPPA